MAIDNPAKTHNLLDFGGMPWDPGMPPIGDDGLTVKDEYQFIWLYGQDTPPPLAAIAAEEELRFWNQQKAARGRRARAREVTPVPEAPVLELVPPGPPAKMPDPALVQRLARQFQHVRPTSRGRTPYTGGIKL
jgi:hypothetical protein